MRTSTQDGRRLGRALTALLAVAFLASPAAQARPDASTGTRVPTETPVVVVDPNEGFDWGDAGLGAGTVAGIALFAGAAAAGLSRRRRVRAAH